MQRLFYFFMGMLVGYYLAQLLAEESTIIQTATSPAHNPAASPTRIHDSLTEISGIGPAYERVLNEMGIYSFQQLAQQDAAMLAGRLKRVSEDRIAGWIQDAKTRAEY